jgi:hypothetical protein
MDALAIADEAPVAALVWARVEQPREPRQRDGHTPAIGQIDY